MRRQARRKTMTMSCLETKEAPVNKYKHHEYNYTRYKKELDFLRQAQKHEVNNNSTVTMPVVAVDQDDSGGVDKKEEPDERLTFTCPSKKIISRKKHQRMHANLSGTKYSVIQEICMEYGFSITKGTDANCFFVWNDSFILPERVVELKPYQRINHFPGMGEICRKDALARHMSKMGKTFPEDYTFAPNTWILPAEFTVFSNLCRELKKKRKHKTFIVKPTNGAMGNGIFLVRNADRIRSNDNIVVQEYVDRPMLLDGYKFDLRVYVLITSCDPLRIFLYNDGLVRLGTESYKNPSDENLSDLFMHLTNYSVNKHNENFSRDEDTDKGSKRSLSYLNQWLKVHGHNVANFWSSIIDIVIKTLIAAQPHVLHSYRLCRPGSNSANQSVCFEILGFDILLDSKLKPWLLEVDFSTAKRNVFLRVLAIKNVIALMEGSFKMVNRSPSFGTDSKLDYDIKSGLLRDTLKLLNIRPSDKRRGMAVEKAQSQKRLFMQPRRSRHDVSESVAKKLILNRRITQLKERLNHIRQDAAKEDYELRNSGNYRSIYPPRDKQRAEYYLRLLDGAFKLFSAGKSSLQKDSCLPFNTLKEEEILDLLEQCESDEHNFLENRKPTVKGPKPLSSMPSSKPIENRNERITEDISDDEIVSRSKSSQQLCEMQNVATRTVPSRQSRPATATQLRTTTPSNKTSRQTRISRSSVLTRFYPVLQDSARDEELTRRTLTLLNEMKIKFPGKDDEEAALILDHAHENWKFHKERVANYWLVKLDSIKRRKVIDIVKTNIRSILQRVWGVDDLDRLKLSRLFSKIFNRMLWSHGQGLWNCFSMFRNSWETMFNKSTDVLTPLEMSCCRRTVALCKECLLVVYLFAATETRQIDTTLLDTYPRT